MDIIEKLKDNLKQLENTRFLDNNKAMIRCKFCGDSIKSNKSHMSVTFKNNVIVYHCYRCGEEGIMGRKFLNKYEFTPIFINTFLKNRNFHTLITEKYSKNNTVSKVIFPEYNSNFKYKKDYCYNRTHIDLSSINNINKYKVIFDIKKFLKINNFNNFTQKELNMIDLVQKNFISFVSQNNSLAICRNVVNNKFRYFNFYFNKDSERSSLYTIHKSIDLSAHYPKIIVTEGIFDIINVNRFLNDNNTNCVYLATNGKESIGNKILHIMKITNFYNAKIEIFSDNDVNRDFYMKKLFNFIKTNIKIVQNSCNKDFGEYKDKYLLKVI